MLIYRIAKCDNTADSRHHTAHEMLSLMLSLYTDHSYCELKKDENSKPYIDSVAFSISHSQDVAVVAMCADRCEMNDTLICELNTDSIGVDIESLCDKNRGKCEKIAMAKFFDSEKAVLSEICDDSLYIEKFCELWTKKESYAKFTGAGLKDALSFDTQKVRDDIRIFSDIIVLGGKKYVISVCYNSKLEK